jgi:hypothetical protein
MSMSTDGSRPGMERERWFGSKVDGMTVRLLRGCGRWGQGRCSTTAAPQLMRSAVRDPGNANPCNGKSTAIRRAIPLPQTPPISSMADPIFVWQRLREAVEDRNSSRSAKQRSSRNRVRPDRERLPQKMLVQQMVTRPNRDCGDGVSQV